MTLSRFELKLAANGTGQVVIDGVDISERVGALRLDVAAPQAPRLAVELVGEGTVEGLAEVTFQSPGVDLGRFFANLDPEELEKEALGRLGFDDANVTQAILSVLTDWALGR